MLIQSLTNSRELFACQPVHHADAAESCFHLDEVIFIFDAAADDLSILAKRIVSHDLKHLFCVFRCADGNDLTLLGDVERVEA